MTVRDTLEYLASFRANWNRRIEADLLERFALNPDQKAGDLSKGQKTQLALIGAICPEPELLVLDEPTSAWIPLCPRVHSDGHRRVSIRRRGEAHGFCFDPPDR
jgi:ABC-2 type transport system ATP-binding protein